MKFRRTGLAAAAVAAAAVTAAACSTSTAGVPQGAPAVQGQAVATSTRAQVTPEAATAPTWVDVTGQGVEQPRDSVDHAQFGATALPGIKVLHATDAAGDMDMCTLGPAVAATGAPQTRGFVVAGHCAQGFSSEQYLQTGASSGTVPLAPVTGAEESPAVDSAVVWTGSVDSAVTRIAGTWPVAGALTETGVQNLVHAGAPVCFDGAKSGVSCGPLISAGQTIEYRGASQRGDSGSAVFVVNATGQAVLIGLLRGDLHDDSAVTVASYLDSALNQLGAQALTAVPPIRGSGYSNNVAQAS